jgi:hypothetical protein
VEGAVRAYLTTSADRALDCVRAGFTDLDEEGGRTGVYLASRPLGADDGFPGDVTLCVDLAEPVFARHAVGRGAAYLLSLVPAAELNHVCRPRVWNHFYVGLSRHDLVESAALWEAGDGVPDGRGHAGGLRAAVRFLDEIDWATPLKRTGGWADD